MNLILSQSRELAGDLSARLRALPIAALAFVFLATGCSAPRIVRVPVSPQDIMQANEAAREADTAFARRDFYAALIKYLEASRLNPNSEFIYNKLGITYSQLQYYREAEEAFERSIGLNPKYAFPFNNLGSVFFATGDKGKAERLFKKAIGLKKNVASFHINLGTLYFERNKFERGMESWRQGLELDPEIMSKSEGVSLVAPGAHSPSSDRSYFMARTFASMGNAEQAVENLQKALNNGFTNLDLIRNEPDFDPIRQDDRYKEFMRMALLLTRN